MLRVDHALLPKAKTRPKLALRFSAEFRSLGIPVQVLLLVQTLLASVLIAVELLLILVIVLVLKAVVLVVALSRIAGGNTHQSASTLGKCT